MNNVAGKMKRGMSEFIVLQVLAHSDVLIRGSQKRQNYDNEMRQEIWADLANQLNKEFDANMDAEKVKQHFNNRRKSIMGRVREELRQNGLDHSPVEQKMEYLRRRKVVSNDSDLKIVEFFLTKEEERSNTPNQTTHYIPMRMNPEINSDAFAILNGLGLNKDTVFDNTDQDIEEDTTETSQHFSLDAQSHVTDQKLPMPIMEPSYDDSASHLVVDVGSKSELKRLLTLLVDNGFYRFTHVDDLMRLPQLKAASGFRPSTLKRRHSQGFSSRDPSPKKTSAGATAVVTLNSDHAASNGSVDSMSCIDESNDDVAENGIGPSTSLLLEMTKVKTEMDEEHDRMEECESLLELVASLNSADSKRGGRSREYKSEGQSIACKLCSTVVRLNSSGSKWNLFEHVVLKHSTHRPFQCPKCPYVAVRKVRVRQHIQSLHGGDEEPCEEVSREVRNEWEDTMAQCFPTHQYKNSTAQVKD